jgi:hypothetical protein
MCVLFPETESRPNFDRVHSVIVTGDSFLGIPCGRGKGRFRDGESPHHERYRCLRCFAGRDNNEKLLYQDKPGLRRRGPRAS